MTVFGIIKLYKFMIETIDEGLSGQEAASRIYANDKEVEGRALEVQKKTSASPRPVGNMIDIDATNNLYGYSLDGDGNIVEFEDAIISAPLPVTSGKSYYYDNGQGAPVAVRWENDEGTKVGSTLVSAGVMNMLPVEGATFARVSVKSQGQPQNPNITFGLTGWTAEENYLANREDDVLASDIDLNILLNNRNNLFRYTSKMNTSGQTLNANGDLELLAGGTVSHRMYTPAINLLNIYATDRVVDASLDTVGNIVAFTGAIVSGKIPVLPNTSYRFEGYPVQMAIREENAAGVNNGVKLTDGQLPYEFTTNNGTYFLRVNQKVQGQAQGYVFVGNGADEQYILSGVPDNLQRAIVFEDANGGKVGFTLTGGVNHFKFAIPAGTMYTRTASLVPSMAFKKAARQFDAYPWEGKRMALFGDSITVDYMWRMYRQKMRDKTKALVANFGLSGGSLATTLQLPQFVDPMLAYNPDIVVIHNVNPHRANDAIGTMASPAGEQSLLGGLKSVCNQLIAQNKNVIIIICTPYPYGDVKPLGYPDSFGSDAPNPQGLYMYQYADMMKHYAQSMGMAIADLSSRCPWRPQVESSVTERVYLLDGVHANVLGYEKMTDVIAEVANSAPF